jgi:hypothetical protein
MCEDCILLHVLPVMSLVKSEGERSESVDETGNEIRVCESVEYTVYVVLAIRNIVYHYVNYMDLEGMYYV